MSKVGDSSAPPKDLTSTLQADLLCGFTVALTSVPQYVAYSELAGLPGAAGIACAGPPLAAYARVSGAPWLAVGVSSISALMAAADLGAERVKAEHGADEYGARVALYSGLVGACSLPLAARGAGALASRIP